MNVRSFAMLAAVGAMLAVHPAPLQAADDTVTFGAAESFTGALAKEGHLEQEGYDFWKDWINARGGLDIGGKRYKVAIKYYDDESNPQTAAKLVEKLIDEDHVNFILGPYGSSPSFSAAAVCERKQIPMVEGNGTSEKIFNQGYRYVFLVGSPAKKYLWGTIEMATKRDPKPKTAAVVAANDTFSLEVQQGAIDNANDHGIRVVYSAKYPAATTDLSTIVSAIKAANPDIILNAGHLQDALLLQKSLKEQNVEAKLYAYSVGPDTPDFVQALGRDANYVFSAAQWSEAVSYKGAPGFIGNSRDYARLYTAKYGHRPDYHSANATAAGLAYQYALARAGTLDPVKVRDALAATDVVTFYGLIKFDARGVNVWKPMVVNQIQSGKLVTVYPYRLGEAPPMYPAPDWSKR
jgi:branched-chain amino acid transport system substrate-binding protein